MHPAGAFSSTYSYDSFTVPRPGTTAVPVRAKDWQEVAVPAGQNL